MSKLNYIVDHPLPINRNFEALKNLGLAYIQRYAGTQWTNLNASDPGVTILEQVCYALTELGYCNDFPVEDILTRPDGKLMMENQFFTPEEILTTASVTTNDYIKYLIDGIDGVTNAVIIPINDTPYNLNTYQVYLQLSEDVLNNHSTNADHCKTAFYYLNKSRNIGELFLMPQVLQPKSYTISGYIDLKVEKGLGTIIAGIQNQIRQSIFPDVATEGYTQLMAKGIAINDIFNGPLLKTGWIPTSALVSKKNALTTIAISSIITECISVSSASITSFDDKDKVYSQISSIDNEILYVDLITSLTNGSLELYYKGKKLSLPTQENQEYVIPDNNILPGAEQQLQTPIPKGRYRDINSYYSIQNTFPEIYAIGVNAVHYNTPQTKIAQSRQLKGFLTLFDQVLANQFSQLANVGNLFSFKNTITGVPSQREEYYAVQDAFQKIHPEYPVPYLSFSATYFYQTLYDIPNIRPLLKDNGVFNFSTELERPKQKEENSWLAYKHDPYNAYSWGLMQLMEDEEDNLTRRNTILNHLLARHGESPEVIMAIIESTVYSGSVLKDQVIFKSLYLQNLDLLSYNRQKGYNYQEADKISDVIPEEVPKNFEHLILGGYANDFIFNSEKIDAAEKLTYQDFINYSGIELKMSLLFGLKVLYKNFIASTICNYGSTIYSNISFWIITQRQGFIFIELPLLLKTVYGNDIINKTENILECQFDSNSVLLIFPDFVPEFITDDFSNRVALFMQDTLPVHIDYNYVTTGWELLTEIIVAFSDWHNSLRYSPKPVLSSREKAIVLLDLINELKPKSYE
ncbi:hypothetical protein DVK85_09085 [Flavobacterium arcticum]|uniref:Uncharacterized protein n=1 Tax=Flavobacterium arcticum TaxID=1784713 RepID=A0A345HCR6_9FLAO|nr:hypothetical protein [Flavobacterium arcticum]AXG74376.1 hypothetical protein DVK85_09085 [Flavobacterium arcticum]KAF2507509.1 hypothetical protein E0W72_11565 [Flavobacterium arcticum]